MDLENLDFGIQSTEEFSMENGSDMEAFLSGETKLEKVDGKKKEEAPVKPKETPKKPAPAAKAGEEEEDDEEDEKDKAPEEDVLEALDKEDEDEEDDKKDDEEGDDAPSETNFEIISKELISLGIFTEEEGVEPPRTPDEFAERFRMEKQKGAVTWLENFLAAKGDDRKELFEAIFVNGVDPKEYLPAYNQLVDYEQLDMSVEAHQEKVYREYYRRLKWDESKIETRLQKMKDYGDLGEEAEEMHTRIIEQDREALLQQEEDKKQEALKKKQADEQYQSSINSILTEALKTKELNGYPVTEAKVRAAYQFLTEPKWKLPSGEVITEYDRLMLESKKPENVKTRAMLALLHLNDYDLSKVEKKAITKETNELFGKLKKTTVKSKNEKVAQSQDFWKGL